MGCGVVFEITPANVETDLHVFTGSPKDGCEPGPYDPALIMDAQGNLFGTTWFGGNANNGVVFELTAGGEEKLLYKFKGAKKGDGAWPLAGLVLDPGTGNLYGTTRSAAPASALAAKRVVAAQYSSFHLRQPSTTNGGKLSFTLSPAERRDFIPLPG